MHAHPHPRSGTLYTPCPQPCAPGMAPEPPTPESGRVPHCALTQEFPCVWTARLGLPAGVDPWGLALKGLKAQLVAKAAEEALQGLAPTEGRQSLTWGSKPMGSHARTQHTKAPLHSPSPMHVFTTPMQTQLSPFTQSHPSAYSLPPPGDPARVSVWVLPTLLLGKQGRQARWVGRGSPSTPSLLLGRRRKLRPIFLGAPISQDPRAQAPLA